MRTKLTKDELAFVHRVMSSMPYGGVSISPDTLMVAAAVADKARRMRDELASAPERGELVLSWRIPREQALTLNQYAQAKGWQKKKLRTALDDALRKLLPKFPKAELHGAQSRRWVRVTRFSTQRVDDLSVDVLGGKLPVDSLVRCEVLCDDDDAHMIREPRWEKTKPGNTHVLIEVFEVAEHEVSSDAPRDSMVEQIVHTPGLMTRAVTEAG